jgi:hypothetical protein
MQCSYIIEHLENSGNLQIEKNFKKYSQIREFSTIFDIFLNEGITHILFQT